MDKIASKYKMIIGELWDLCSVHAILLHAQTIFVEDESSAVLKGYSPILRSALLRVQHGSS